VAPEQAQAEPLDARADLYSLAALTYLLLAGRAPYAHADLAAAARPLLPPPLSTPERPYSDDVEAVVRRGLALDRDDRWPDVASYVAALEAALGEPTGGPTTEPWLPLDPHLTQPGARPSPLPATGPLGDPTPPPGRRRRRLLGAVAGMVVLAIGGSVGYVVQQQLGGQVTLTDDQGNISVTVPKSWDKASSTRGWIPPNAADASTELPAVSVGTSPTWATAGGAAEGVFAGLLPGTELPDQLPQHPDCATAGDRMDDDSSPLGSSAATVVYSSCPDGFTVERVVQVTTSQLLWVQVRSTDRATANEVLDSVEVHGM
jgi:hypothetical protein